MDPWHLLRRLPSVGPDVSSQMNRRLVKRRLFAFAVLVGVVAIAVLGFVLRVELGWPIMREIAAPAITVEPTSERLARGKKLVRIRCALCHYDQKTNALTGAHLVSEPKEFGTVYSANITAHPALGTGRYTDGELMVLLRTGVKRDGVSSGQYMASPFLADEDLYSIIAFLRSDDPWIRPHDTPSKKSEWTFQYKAIATFTFPEHPMPSEPIERPKAGDAVALGRYIVTAVADCFVCHSESFPTLDAKNPENSAGYMGGGNSVLDARRKVVRGANLTMDADTGIGTWSEDDFVRAVRTGMRPDNRPLRYPMLAYPDLSEDEVRAVWAYLQTLPKLHNDVPRDIEEVVASAPLGERLYRRYQCTSCHGDEGAGTCDLRQARERYPTAESLVAFLRDPNTFVPGTKMPAFHGVIAEDEWVPLVSYVRQLEAASKAP